jgi:flagellar basal body rod protein FlgG
MNINNNTSSIYAHQNLLNSSAHNIANSNTENFERTDTKIVGGSNDSVKAVFEKVENPNIYSNTDLVKEMTDQILSYQAVGANVVSLQTQNEVSGTLLDIKA